LSCSCLKWGTFSEAIGVIAHPLNGVLVNEQLTRSGIDENLSHFANDTSRRRREHHGHRPARPVADDKFGFLAAHSLADLSDYEASYFLTSNERSDVGLGGRFDAASSGGPLWRGDTWQVNAHKVFLGE
jgi:hypothetical protein